jgi:ABC-type Na+ efflux pump permease subunit
LFRSPALRRHDYLQTVQNLFWRRQFFFDVASSFSRWRGSTGEEREKRVLLGLLMTPVSPLEVMAAKAIFYASASLVVAPAIVGMYQPRLLLNPFLWGGVICGSVSYVAIGTVAITIVRRQTTINTVSMLYLIATSLIMILSQFLPLFSVFKLLLVENYLHGLMKLIISGERSSGNVLGYTMMLGVGTICWTILAVWVFAKKGTSMSCGR